MPIPSSGAGITSNRRLVILAGIAALIATGTAWFVSAHKKPFCFEMEFHSTRDATAQLFYDVGRGQNQADSVRLLVRAAESMTTARFPLPAGDYRAFRFDPVDAGECRVIIRNARIVDILGRPLWEFSPEEFGSFHATSERVIEHEELRLHFAATDNDPYCAINAPLTLRPSVMSSYQFTGGIFLLCFAAVGFIGLCGLFLASRGWILHGLLLLLLAAFVYLFARSRFLAPFSFDEEVFIWYGSLVNHGSVPYRDIFEPKPPVIFFVNALGLALFGLKDFLFRIVPTAVAVSSIVLLLVALLKRRVLPWLSILLTAQIALWLLGSDFHDTSLNDSETYGFAFTILGFSLGSLAAGLRRIALPVLSGICLGLAVLSKEFFVFAAVPAWLMVARRPDDGKLDVRQLILSAAGGVAIGLAFLAYLIAHSAFGSYLDLLRFSKALAANYAIDSERFPRVSGLSVILPSWKMLHAQLYNLAHLGFVLPLWAAALILAVRKRKDRFRIVDLAIAMVAFVLGMVGVSVGYCFWRHYFLIGAAGLLLISTLGAEAASDYLSARDWRASLGAFIALAGLFLFVAKPQTQVMLAEKPAGYLLPWDFIVTETIEGHSRPGDYILAPEGPVIYVAMNRRCPLPVAGPSDDILPYMAVANSTLQMESLHTELEKNLPKVCYFPGRFHLRQKMWHELLYDPLLAKYHYIKVDDRLWYLPDSHD
jgi:4-amino-4-deoxy-L-arabinose transferase-like glycosyltransferase